MAITAMTTNSSMSVKPRRHLLLAFISLLPWNTASQCEASIHFVSARRKTSAVYYYSAEANDLQ
jgi:hypothetical protein